VKLSLKLQPVAWLTGASVVVGGLLEADAQFHLLPTSWGRWLAFGAAALGLVIAGSKARSVVTPLAAPHDSAGTPLVPIAMRGPTQPPDLPGVPGEAWRTSRRTDG
jgi:hypothetical protein